MAQYTSTETTTTNIVVNAVLDTETNQITYTVTAPNGASGTSTQPASQSGNSSSNVRNLFQQLAAGGYTGQPGNLSTVLSSVTEDVNNQAAAAARTANATNTDVPANPSPAAPVPAASNPNPVPTEQQDQEIPTDAPSTVTAETDPFEAERLAAEQRLAEQENIQYEAPPNIGPEDPVEALNEQSRLEAEQEFNRQELQREEAAGAGDAMPTGLVTKTQSTATEQDAVSFQKAKDWRVRLSLAPGSKYFYNNIGKEGILKPLAATNGVVFPYTPAVSVSYNAAYESSDLIHSNYKIYNYKNSSVDNVTITGEFTAQDTNEANYLLAVIHFFRSVTKMFYGRDQNPRNGVPPPLCYLSGLGTFQFDNHPLVITNFTYTLPTEVDYIRAGSQTNQPGNNTGQQTSPVNTDPASLARILSSNLGPKTPNFQRQAATINSDATYVPTKMSITITCIPVVTRNDVSNNFSLEKYASGALLQGSKRNGGGIW